MVVRSNAGTRINYYQEVVEEPETTTGNVNDTICDWFVNRYPNNRIGRVISKTQKEAGAIAADNVVGFIRLRVVDSDVESKLNELRDPEKLQALYHGKEET